MNSHAFEDFEDEGLAAFIESASDDFAAQMMDDEQEEITVCRPMILRFAAEDADQLVVNIAGLRHTARLFVEDARAAMTSQLEGIAPKAADQLRARLTAALDACEVAFNLAVRIEKAAVYALREGVAPVEADDDPEEARLEANPPEPDKVKLSPACQSLRRQFFAASKKVGLITRTEVRVQRIAAISNLVGRALDSTSDLSEEEWTKVVYSVEDGRLQW